MKAIDIILGLLFLSFAAVQYNDPDGLLWMIPYGVVALFAFAHRLGHSMPRLAGITCVFLLVWALSYLPEMYNWVQQGMPNITGSMKAETPYIENAREFLGLILCFVTTLYYYKKGNKMAKK
jgi:hypothetical protein